MQTSLTLLSLFSLLAMALTRLWLRRGRNNKENSPAQNSSRRPAAARQLSAALLSALVLILLGFSLSGWRSAAGRQAMPTATGQNGLAAALNPDGSLRAGASGSFDASGFRMEYSATGAPRFVAAPQMACSGWDTQFSLPNGVSDDVQALLVSGTDLYLGGRFMLAGNVAANRVAKFDTLTNTWSAFGTGGGSG